MDRVSLYRFYELGKQLAFLDTLDEDDEVDAYQPVEQGCRRPDGG